MRRSIQNFTPHPHHEATMNGEESGKLGSSLGSLPGLTFPNNNHKLTPVTPKARFDKLILDRVRIGERSAMNCELKLTKRINLDLLVFTHYGSNVISEMLIPRFF